MATGWYSCPQQLILQTRLDRSYLIFVAVGAYLGGIRFGYNPGRGPVVAGAVLAFLALWGVLLYGRARGS